MSDELKPCPFCGSEYTQVRWIGFTHTHNGAFTAGYRGECCDCWATTRAFNNEADAATVWNTRADDAPEQPDTSSQTVRNGDSYNLDTREQLEADVRDEVKHFFAWQEKREQFANKIIEWLDRQAAISEREAFMRGRASLDDEFAELTAERDQLKERVARFDSISSLDGVAHLLVQFEDLTAERDELQAAIDAMHNGQFYAMYKAKCEECEEAVSFAKRLENAVNDGQPVTLFGVDYFTAKQNKKLLAEHKQLTKKLKRLRRRLAKAKKERDHLKTVVKTQADSFKKLEAELTQARSNQAGKDG